MRFRGKTIIFEGQVLLLADRSAKSLQFVFCFLKSRQVVDSAGNRLAYFDP